jgi:hypothetical protein
MDQKGLARPMIANGLPDPTSPNSRCRPIHGKAARQGATAPLRQGTKLKVNGQTGTLVWQGKEEDARKEPFGQRAT